MKPALISEWRKLMTVRSTFVMAGLVTLIITLVSFFVFGYKASASSLAEPRYLYQNLQGIIGSSAIAAALAAILLVSHEYRYNTIMHTLTATRNRLHVLVAKAAVSTVFAVVLTLLVMIASVGATVLGNRLQGAQLAAQDLPLLSLLGSSLFYTWGYAMFGLLLALLVRNQVASIVALLAFPTAGEGILFLVLRGNSKYLPFQALSSVQGDVGAGYQSLSTGPAIMVVLAYIIVGAIAAAILLQRRDAN